MKILSAAEFERTKAQISGHLKTAQEDLALDGRPGIGLEKAKLAALNLYLIQAKPDFETCLKLITPYFLEEDGDTWIIENFKNNLNDLIRKAGLENNASGVSDAYSYCVEKLAELIQTFS